MAWVYLIDGTTKGTSTPAATLPDAQAALQRGRMAARTRADEMDG